MPWTVADLFAMGAQNTVLSLIGQGEATFADITAALERRFGTIPADSSLAIAELREQVIASTTAAEAIPLIDRPNPASYGRNPALPEQYRYTVLAKLPDPLNPGQNIEIPWTIDSPTPLSANEILAQAESDLNEGYSRSDKYQSAIYADLHRRDIAFRRTVQEQYGGNAPIDIQVLGAYKRG